MTVDCMSCLVAMDRGMSSSGAHQDCRGITHAALVIRRQVAGDFGVDYRDVRVLVCSLAQVGFGGIFLDEVRSVPR